MPQFEISYPLGAAAVLWRKTSGRFDFVTRLIPHGLLFKSPDAARSAKLFADKQWGVRDFGSGVFVVVRERGCETWLISK